MTKTAQPMDTGNKTQQWYNNIHGKERWKEYQVEIYPTCGSSYVSRQQERGHTRHVTSGAHPYTYLALSSTLEIPVLLKQIAPYLQLSMRIS